MNREEQKENWFKAHPKLSKLCIVLFMLFVLECVIRLFAWTGLFPYQRYPTTHKPVYWDDINPHYGVWRYENASFRHKSPCFDVMYQSNSYGARDREHEKKSNDFRFVVLGDSYVEGYGVEEERRFDNLLEVQIGKEFLNFGTSGSFGSIQQWQVYEHLAMSFDHQAVMIFHLPFNDFSDNNPKDFPANRYRPYLKKEEGSFALYYPVEFDKRGRDFRKKSKVIKNIIDNTWYTANFLRWATRMFKKETGLKKEKTFPASYESYSEEDMAILQHSYEKIIELAKGKPVYIFSIPAHEDYKKKAEGQTSFKLNQDLEAFAKRFPNVEYIDLLKPIMEYTKQNNLDHDAITLGCDGHWGNLGHRIVADALKAFLVKKHP